MLERNKKKKVSKKKYPIRVYGYMGRQDRSRLESLSKLTGKSVSALIREGLDLLCEKYGK